MSARVVSIKQHHIIRSMRSKCLSLRAIAVETGWSWSCVKKHAGDIPVKCKPGPKGMTDAVKFRMLSASNSGVSREEIARRFGVSISSVGPMLCAIRKLQQGSSS